MTDDFAGEYGAVWVSIGRITAIAGGVETDLVTFSPARVVNLPDLKRAGLFAGIASIPAGTTAFRVYVGNEARIVGLDGIERTVQLATTAGYVEFAGTSWVSQSGVLALDFDLPRFVLAGNVLTPATRLADTGDLNQWTTRRGEIQGTVVTVSATQLTLRLADGSQVDITLDANTTYRSSTSTTWMPAVGQRVEAKVLLGGTIAQPVYVARSVHDESLFTTTGVNSRPEIVGTVVSVAGTTAVVDIVQSEDISLTGRVTLDFAGAVFKRGMASLLLPGVQIEGHVSSATTPSKLVAIEIAGAAKTEVLAAGGTGISHGAAELKGSVITVNGGVIDLTLFKVSGLSAYTVGSTASVSTVGAYFEKGSLACLVAGSPVDLEGYADSAGKFVAVKVELEGGCGSGTGSGGSAVAGQISEAKGLVQVVGTNQFTLKLFKTENWVGTPPASVTVTYDQTTTFGDLAVSALAAGQFVEVKGVVTDGVLKANRVGKE